MPIFTQSDGKLTPINELVPTTYKEQDVQRLTEANLEAVFNLTFVTTEFQLNGLRVDTLAFDPESKAFVIIEYKRDRSFSVIDQGYAYLSLMLNHKADFILEYNEHMPQHLGKTDVDWTQSRVIFVANSFTTYQQQAINFRDLPMELWEAKRYDNGTILYNQLKTPSSNESIKTISRQNTTIEQVSSEVKKYTIDDHLAKSKPEVVALFNELGDQLSQLDRRFSANPRASYIGFALGENGSKSILYVHPLVDKLRIDIPRIHPEDVIDPRHLLRYKPHSLERYNTPVSQLFVQNFDDIPYLIPIVREVMGRLGK